jgi:regulator of RNase E activity RraB
MPDELHSPIKHHLVLHQIDVLGKAASIDAKTKLALMEAAIVK